MPKKSISYPKVCKRYDGLYYIDFKLNNKRIRMFSGKKIGSSTNPNTFPLKFRRNETINLAKEVYDYLVSNNYSFVKRPNTKLEFFDYLIERKLSENLFNRCLLLLTQEKLLCLPTYTLYPSL